jgi:hypothetical protein
MYGQAERDHGECQNDCPIVRRKTARNPRTKKNKADQENSLRESPQFSEVRKRIPILKGHLAKIYSSFLFRTSQSSETASDDGS